MKGVLQLCTLHVTERHGQTNRSECPCFISPGDNAFVPRNWQKSDRRCAQRDEFHVLAVRSSGGARRWAEFDMEIQWNGPTKETDCSREEATLGAARAVRGRRLVGKVKLVGFDASPSLQQGLRGGVIDALLVQDTFRIGYLGVETVVRKLNGETPERLIHFPARIITAADLDDPTVRKLVDGNLE